MKLPRIHFLIDLVFFGCIFLILGLNSWFAGAQDFDPHWGYLTYIAGLSSQGLIAGLDYISGYAFIIPSLQGLLVKLFGLTQVQLFVSSNLCLYTIFILSCYKINRLFMTRYWSKLACVILLMAFPGLGLPWFNKTMMVFVSLGLYCMCKYLIKPRLWLLLVTGILVACFPYLRYQAIFISVFFFMIPGLAYYFKFIKKREAIRVTLTLIGIFIGCHVGFIILVALSGKFDNYKETMSAIFSFSREVAPVLTKGYLSIVKSIINTIFNFSLTTVHRWGGMDHAIRDWVFVFISGLYFGYQILVKKIQDKTITIQDFIMFLVAGTVFSSYALIYPHVSEHRAQAQFGLGLGLVIMLLLNLFEYKNTPKLKLLSILLIFISLFYIYYGRINTFTDLTVHSYSYMIKDQHELIKFKESSAFDGMLLEKEVAGDLQKALTVIKQLEESTPGQITIFHGPWYEKYGKLLALSARNFKLHVHTVINDFSLAEDIQPYLIKYKPILIVQATDPKNYIGYLTVFSSQTLNLKILQYK